MIMIYLMLNSQNYSTKNNDLTDFELLNNSC